MKEATIEELAYVIKQAKDNNQPRPIFFLGAGASVTGGIPLTNKIIEDIFETYGDAPKVKNIKDSSPKYDELMACLRPSERDNLLKGYIDEAKINVTHIYLAQLMCEDMVDYVLTVNFDNLMLRALALYNQFPSTYDMAILKDLTTTAFKKKSVVYLHGQHHGLWLLNTPEEMERVNKTVPKVFDSIKNERPWVFIGYSANDPIFKHVKDLGRFDNDLYWVCFKDENPNDKVVDFLSNPTTNAFSIKGYDADAFMLKLNAELKLEQPQIIDKPFTSVRNMLNEIVDIEDEEHFKSVNNRLNISKEQVERAIKQFELGEVARKEEIEKQAEIDNLKKELINILIDKKYIKSQINDLENKVKYIDSEELNEYLANVFCNWGLAIETKGDLKEETEKEALYIQAVEKYRISLDLKTDSYGVYNNYGIVTDKIADLKKEKEKEAYYLQAIDKYKKAIDIEPDSYEAYYNLGVTLDKIADLKEEKEKEAYYLEAIDKYKKAIDIEPDSYETYHGFGVTLDKIADLKEEKEPYYLQSIEKYKKSIDIKRDSYKAYHNLGVILYKIADLKEEKEKEAYYLQSIEKYKKSISIKPDFPLAYDNIAHSLINLSYLKIGDDKEKILEEALEKAYKTFELIGGAYNVSCIHALRDEKDEALKYLDITLKNKQISIEHVENDKDWDAYKEDEDLIKLLDKYRDN